MKQFFRFFFLTLVFSFSASADPIRSEDLKVLMTHIYTGVKMYGYLAPNEQSPIEVQPLLDEAPAGRGFFVGTERGFIAAGLSEKITGLDLVDFSEQVVIYNSINWALLKSARTREEYLFLRTKANAQEWLRFARSTNHALTKMILSSVPLWSWWQQAMRVVRDDSEFHGDPKGITIDREFVSKIEFEHANYLFYDEQFLRVKKLVDRGAIRIAKMDLKDIGHVLSFIDDLSVRKSEYSVVDISNAWQSIYLGPIHTAIFIDGLSTRMSNDGIFIFTNQGGHANPGPTRNYRKYHQLAWQYAGFHVHHVTAFKSTVEFVQNYLWSSKLFATRLSANQTSLDADGILTRCHYLFR